MHFARYSCATHAVAPVSVARHRHVAPQKCAPCQTCTQTGESLRPGNLVRRASYYHRLATPCFYLFLVLMLGLVGSLISGQAQRIGMQRRDLRPLTQAPLGALRPGLECGQSSLGVAFPPLGASEDVAEINICYSLPILMK